MSGINLKHYSEYVGRIEAYAAANGIKLEYKPIINDGIYFPSKRLIRIDPDMSDSSEIATMLHELGHTIDDYLLDVKLWNKICTAYNAFYKNRATPAQKKLVFATEERAWKCGRIVAKNLHIRLGKWYDDEETDALKTYRDHK